jgi:hypothetical protein
MLICVDCADISHNIILQADDGLIPYYYWLTFFMFHLYAAVPLPLPMSRFELRRRHGCHPAARRPLPSYACAGLLLASRPGGAPRSRYNSPTGIMTHQAAPRPSRPGPPHATTYEP